MNTINNLLKQYPMVQVEWIDATDHTEIEIIDIKNTKTYFTKRISIGRLIKKDKYGVIIMTDIDESHKVEITAVPNNFKPKVRYIKE